MAYRGFFISFKIYRKKFEIRQFHSTTSQEELSEFDSSFLLLSSDDGQAAMGSIHPS